MIPEDLRVFQDLLDRVWTGIENSCRSCTDPDCLGYIWTVPSEQDNLLDSGVGLLQINGSAVFLDNYPRGSDGEVILGSKSPHCPYRSDTGLCSVHGSRPLVCRMYPLGIETINAVPWWVLYLDCNHVRLAGAAGLERMATELIQLTGLIPDLLLDEILLAYRSGDELSSWPDGVNRYQPLAEVRCEQVQDRPR